MIQAAAVTLFAASAAHAQQPVQWRVQDGGNGHWYWIRPEQSGWSAAKAAAEGLGAHLACMESEEEWQWTRGWLPSILHGYWLGGYQLPNSQSPSSGWRWLSGGAVAEAWMFMDDNPCGSSVPGVENMQQDFLHVCCEAYPQGWSWGDLDDLGGWGCDLSLRSLIEWSADCNADGIIDYGQILDGYLSDLDGDNVPDCCELGVACVQVGSGLEAHFEFDGDCLDASGNERHGVSTGLAYALGPEGLPETAAVFDGSSSDVRIQGVPIPTNNAFSWAMWLRVDSIGNAAVLERIESIGNNLMSPSLWVRSDGALGFGSYSFQSGGTSVETSSNTLTAGTWIHVACTSARSGLRRVYVNGTLVGENLSADYGQPLPMILIGRDRLDCCSRFRGAIDDLRVYSRPLTPAEVDALYRAASLCAGDIVEDDNVNGADLGALLFYWGVVTSAPLSQACDLDRSGTVDGADLGALLASWGACP